MSAPQKERTTNLILNGYNVSIEGIQDDQVTKVQTSIEQKR